MEYWVSPAVRKVLACSSREGETVEGKFVERLAPDVVIARLMSGTASSIRVRSLRMSWTIKFSSCSFCSLLLALELRRRVSSSAVAAKARR